MNIVRQYKLSYLGIDTKYKEVFKFLDHELKNLKPTKLKKYEDSVNYFNNDKLIFEYTFDYKIYIRWENFWEVLKKKYFLEDFTIKEILNYLIVKKYNFYVEEILIFPNYQQNIIEKEYKQTTR